MSERNGHNLWGMVALAAALVVAAAVLGGALKDIRRTDTITVTGSARKPIRSDFVIWRGSVSSQKSTMQEAYQDVKRYGDRLKSYFKEHRVPESAVEFGAISNEPIQEWLPERGSTGRILGYRIWQQFTIRSAQVDSIAALAQSSSELINEGVPLMASSPEFLFTKLAEMRVEMLGEASKDAKQRAEKIAEAVGCKIGAVRTARMGVFQITARNSTEVSDYGVYDTSSLEKDITAVVSLSFSVD